MDEAEGKVYSKLLECSTRLFLGVGCMGQGTGVLCVRYCIVSLNAIDFLQYLPNGFFHNFVQILSWLNISLSLTVSHSLVK